MPIPHYAFPQFNTFAYPRSHPSWKYNGIKWLPGPGGKKLSTSTARMPKRIKLRGGKRKRRGMKRRRIPRMLVPFSRVIRMRTSEYVSLAGNTGALASQLISINNLTDPFSLGSSQQPLYYDQVKALYRSAIVIGAKVWIAGHNSSDDALIWGLGVRPYDVTNEPTSYEWWKELGAKTRILSKDVDHGVLSASISVKKYFKVKNLTDGSEYVSDIENDTAPTKVGYWILFAQALNQTASITCQCHLTMEYIVLLRDPYVPQRSTA